MVEMQVGQQHDVDVGIRQAELGQAVPGVLARAAPVEVGQQPRLAPGLGEAGLDARRGGLDQRRQDRDEAGAHRGQEARGQGGEIRGVEGAGGHDRWARV